MAQYVHFVGIGGINMSAVAKLLLSKGIRVSGSDRMTSEQTEILLQQGAQITIGHHETALPKEADLVVYSSAVPETNPERQAAQARGVRQINNFEFLAELAEDQETVLITGTHGKSTTTALTALMAIESGLDPLVIVGSKVPGFPEGNLRFGSGQHWIIEGDEYAKHFLAFHPTAVLINNIELDHTDIFPNLEAIIATFRTLLDQVKDGGLVVANSDDKNIEQLMQEEREALEKRAVRIVTYGYSPDADVHISQSTLSPGKQTFSLTRVDAEPIDISLSFPGKMNVLNASGATTLTLALGGTPDAITQAATAFTGIWRRFQRISEKEGVLVISDYAHHPTAIHLTLEAAKSFYPERRILLCFQPHHRNRVRHLFADFVSSFDLADALILSEIYDVAGRDGGEDASLSSKELLTAIQQRDADQSRTRPLAYAKDSQQALELIKDWKQAGDLVLVMGAGDIYQIAEKV